jgi:hypothetical protein
MLHVKRWQDVTSLLVYILNVNSVNAHFTLGVKANVQFQSSIPIGAKIEISPKGPLH